MRTKMEITVGSIKMTAKSVGRFGANKSTIIIIHDSIIMFLKLMLTTLGQLLRRWRRHMLETIITLELSGHLEVQGVH